MKYISSNIEGGNFYTSFQIKDATVKRVILVMLYKICQFYEEGSR
jgi:hypothetical protein